jgi:hypothetical protein
MLLNAAGPVHVVITFDFINAVRIYRNGGQNTIGGSRLRIPGTHKYNIHIYTYNIHIYTHTCVAVAAAVITREVVSSSMYALYCHFLL